MGKNVKIIKSAQCYGCYACINVCPKKCITMIEDKYGFAIPKVNNKECVKCGLCLQVCPAKNKYKLKKKFPIKIYAANVRDKDIRMKSTSGGMFYPIAEYVINNSGCVFGAAFNSKYDVIHICAETISEVERCMKSKYVQSNIGDCFSEAAKRSRTQMVLFTGTPCQIAAFKKYPGVRWKNVITMDVICHGVPSPRVWKKYLKEMQAKYGDIMHITMRSKERYGQSQSETVIFFDSKEVYHEIADKDCYIKAFTNGYSLRERCYCCRYKGTNYLSDITVSDFYSINKYIKDADSFSGVSRVVTNTEKGEQIMELLKDKIEMKEVNTKEGLLDEPAWGFSCIYNVRRRLFYNNCFIKNYSIKRSLLRARKEAEEIHLLGEIEKEICSNIRKKAQEFYYKYIFQLRV